jgi:hypothetical protein
MSLKTLHPQVQALFEKDAWSEHSDHTREAWRDEVREGNTQIGYWEWVSNQIWEAEDEC